MVRKDIFLKKFYDTLSKDIVAAVDDILLVVDRYELSEHDKTWVSLAREFRLKPNFQNVCFSCEFPLSFHRKLCPNFLLT